MTINKTNKVQVLFQELSEEHTASITGGVAILASSSAEIKTNNPTTPTNPINTTPTIKSVVENFPSILGPVDKLYFIKQTGDNYTLSASVLTNA